MGKCKPFPSYIGLILFLSEFIRSCPDVQRKEKSLSLLSGMTESFTDVSFHKIHESSDNRWRAGSVLSLVSIAIDYTLDILESFLRNSIELNSDK